MPELHDPGSVSPVASPAKSVRVAPIMWRMLAWNICSTAAIAVAVSLICLKLGPDQWRLNALLWTLFGANLVVLFRWFYGALRRAGYPLTFTVRLVQWQLAAVYAVGLIGAVLLTYFVYRWTANRIVEGIVALCFVPLFLLLATRVYSLQPAPKAEEAGTLRWSYIMQFVLPVLFGANLVLQLLPQHHDYANVDAARDWIIAAYFVIIPVNPITGYRLRQRYLKARALGAPKSQAPTAGNRSRA